MGERYIRDGREGRQRTSYRLGQQVPALAFNDSRLLLLERAVRLEPFEGVLLDLSSVRL